ncbi:MAG: ComEA family DNA-binding protein [Caldilineaceae bacterium]|nr:ComEA family DNA-binding protein [Caldilineaceae bacterium]
MHSPSPAPISVDANATTQPADPLASPNRSSFFLIQIFALGVVAGLLISGLLMLLMRRTNPPPIVLQPPPTPAPTATPLPTATPAPIVVFVSGAVAMPGLYALPSDARLGDALRAAGGMLADAVTSINQAERLWDGAQVHVPAVTEAPASLQPSAGVSGAPPAVSSASPSTASGGKININTASADQLTSLPGIGPARAAAIVAGRPYATVDDLERVSGIGPKTIEQLRDLITTQ